MTATRQRDTAAEVAVRSLVHRQGLRYRVDAVPLPGLRRKADLLFAHARVAVFVDGCFWHGCPIHGTWPKANAEFWRAKILANRRRDLETDQILRRAGWMVVRVWEHRSPRRAAARIVRVVRSRSG